MASARTPHGSLMTAEQLFDLPDDGMRHELVEGILRTIAPAGAEHGRVAGTLLVRVGTTVAAGRLGTVFAAETGFVLRRDPDTVRAPDLAFVRAERAAEARVSGFPSLAPDLVAEVVSPNDRLSDVMGTVQSWLKAGVRVVWVVDPASRTVTVHRNDAAVRLLRDGDVLRGDDDVLPDFVVPLPELWA